ncbi:apoptosis-stimulating of p53 protein 2-like, partial [Mizuhopecten yessoensis]|uniref:apoptosis-stimulating of p53 protein 2-like n=1 Tax=Mizuhopecten yessoensis TaxID=6573 RepID=UPI000B457653
MRNKLNEQQSSKLKNHKDMLKQRKDEISKMDNRILELQQRLKKKRAQQAEQQKKLANQQSDNKSGNKPTRNNVAAVEPYVQIVPKDQLNGNVDPTFHKADPKYQSLPVSSKFVMNSSDDTSKKQLKSVENVPEPNNNTVMKGPEELKSKTLTAKVDPSKSVPKENGYAPSEHVHKETRQTPSQPQYSTSGQQQGKHPPPPIPARAGTTNLTYLTARPFGSTYSTSVLNRGPSDQQGGPTITIAEDIRTGGSGQSSPASSDSSQKENSAYPSDHQSTNRSEKQTPLLNGTNGSNTNNGASTRHGGPNKHPPPYPGGSVPPNKQQGAPPPYPHSQQNARSYDQTDSMKDTNSNNGSDSSLNSDSGSSSKQQPKYKYASKNVIANTYMGKLGPEALKKYQQNINMMYTNISKKDGAKTNKSSEDKSHTNTNQKPPNSANSLSPPSSSASQSLSPPVSSPKGGKPSSPPTSPQYTDIASDKVSHNRHTHKHVNLRRRHSDSDNEDITKLLHKYVDRYKNQSGYTSQETGEGRHIGGYDTQATSFQDQVPEDVPVDGMGNLIDLSDKGKPADGSDGSKTSSPASLQIVTSDQPVKKKTNLKNRNAKKSGNRVSFDPLALLLDSSLEGELELVKRCASQVHDVSEPNDEGITALHNAICAGHYEIVKFLVEFGCDVNSPDSDGWTPLHCAASCNNLPMVKFLVEHGACIFATTISDQETAAEKCEEEEDGFDGCSEYLY